MDTPCSNPTNKWEEKQMTRLWKNGNWNDEQLKHALRVINGQSRVLMASMEFCIMVSILRKHFFGTTVLGRKGGGGGVRIQIEEIVKFVRRWQALPIQCLWPNSKS
jgi:hypothetical protein